MSSSNGNRLEFTVATVTANSGGTNGGGAAILVHNIALQGAAGEILRFVFGAHIPEGSVQKQSDSDYLVEFPVVEFAGFLAFLQALRQAGPIRALVVEAPNGVTSYDLFGYMA